MGTLFYICSSQFIHLFKDLFGYRKLQVAYETRFHTALHTSRKGIFSISQTTTNLYKPLTSWKIADLRILPFTFKSVSTPS